MVIGGDVDVFPFPTTGYRLRKWRFQFCTLPPTRWKKPAIWSTLGFSDLGRRWTKKTKRVFYNPLWFLMSSAVLFIGRLNICLNKIWILYCPFPFGTKDLKVLTNAETRPGLGQDGTSHTFFCHNHGTYDWICFHALWHCSLVLFERSFGWLGILLMVQKSGSHNHLGCIYFRPVLNNGINYLSLNWWFLGISITFSIFPRSLQTFTDPKKGRPNWMFWWHFDSS